MTMQTQTTIDSLLEAASLVLKSAGVENPIFESQLLLAAVLKTKPGRLLSNKESEVSSGLESAFWALIEKRAQGSPAAYLMGETEFMGLRLFVDPRVLIPRPETELLVETCLAIIRTGQVPENFGEPPRPAHLPLRKAQSCHSEEGLETRRRIWPTTTLNEMKDLSSLDPSPTAQNDKQTVLDLGTGSGCIAVSLAIFEPRLKIMATDISFEALEVTQKNVAHYDLTGRIVLDQGDLFEPAKNFDAPGFQLIVSNAPYVSSEDWNALSREVLQEPRNALDGGAEGLETLEKIISQAPGYLKDGGWLVLEIGQGQSLKVKDKMKAAGFDSIRILKDFNHIPRIAAGSHGRV